MNVRENQKGHVGGFKEEREIRNIEIILQSQRLEKYKKKRSFLKLGKSVTTQHVYFASHICNLTTFSSLKSNKLSNDIKVLGRAMTLCSIENTIFNLLIKNVSF